MSTNELQKYIFEILGNNFDRELSFQIDNPSERYFWYRKRKQVANLIKKNIALFSNLDKSEQEYLFVDVGCGEGLDLFLLRDMFEKLGINNYKFLGLEGFPLSHEIAKAKKQYLAKSNIDFELVELTQGLSLESGSVDVIYCSEVVEHLINPENLLNEFRRVLKPGGYLILSTPNEPNLFQKAFWLSSAKENLKLVVENRINNPKKKAKVGSQEVLIYGHVSCRPATQWDKALRAIDFDLVDYRRGALIYGGREFENWEFFLGFRLLLEGILDLLPKALTRSISDQMITLYKLKDK